MERFRECYRNQPGRILVIGNYMDSGHCCLDESRRFARHGGARFGFPELWSTILLVVQSCESGMGTICVIHVSAINCYAGFYSIIVPNVDRSACISTCGWWLGLASVCNFVAATMLAILQICVEEYTPSPSHQWFGYVAVLWLAVLLNIYAARSLPALNQYLRG